MKADDWRAYEEGTIRILSNDRWSTYNSMSGELCYGLSDTEFDQLLKAMAAEQALGPSF